MTLFIPAIYVHTESSLPWWQLGILTAVGVAMAAGLLLGVARVFEGRSRLRDARLRACFLAIEDALGRGDAARLEAFATPELSRQLARGGSEIRLAHSSSTRAPVLDRLTILAGGGKTDRHCTARMQSSGTEATWRFVRDPQHGWVVAEIDLPRVENRIQSEKRPELGVQLNPVPRTRRTLNDAGRRHI